MDMYRNATINMYVWSSSLNVNARSTLPFSVFITIPRISRYWDLSSSPTPMASKTFHPFLNRVNDVPPVRNDSACSSTTDRTPNLCSETAVDRPAIPAPTMTTSSFRISDPALTIVSDVSLIRLGFFVRIGRE